jgi:hypothetical protein
VTRSGYGSKAGQVDCNFQEKAEIIQTFVMYQWHDSMAEITTE